LGDFLFGFGYRDILPLRGTHVDDQLPRRRFLEHRSFATIKQRLPIGEKVAAKTD